MAEVTFITKLIKNITRERCNYEKVLRMLIKLMEFSLYKKLEAVNLSNMYMSESLSISNTVYICVLCLRDRPCCGVRAYTAEACSVESACVRTP